MFHQASSEIIIISGWASFTEPDAISIEGMFLSCPFMMSTFHIPSRKRDSRMSRMMAVSLGLKRNREGKFPVLFAHPIIDRREYCSWNMFGDLPARKYAVSASVPKGRCQPWLSSDPRGRITFSNGSSL
jgi:hypothetical protein